MNGLAYSNKYIKMLPVVTSKFSKLKYELEHDNVDYVGEILHRIGSERAMICVEILIRNIYITVTGFLGGLEVGRDCYPLIS